MNGEMLTGENQPVVRTNRHIGKYFILGFLGIILVTKLYFLLYINFFVGIYSLLSTSLLFAIFLTAYLKFKDPFCDSVPLCNSLPLVSIIVPVRNEEGNIRNCVQSCIDCSYPNKEIIIVNDFSTDNTQQILRQMEIRYEHTISVIHLSKNVGKKLAVEYGTNIAKGNIYAFMDSDCNMASDSVDKAVKIFHSHPRLGALTAHGRVRDVERRSALEKIQDVWFDGQFRIIKGMESSFCSLTCCSGALSFFRREAIQGFIHEWAHDKFLGIEDFRFGTDRRLTAHVLGGTYVAISNSDSQNAGINNVPIFSTVKPRGTSTIKPIYVESEINDTSESVPKTWEVMYTRSIRVYMGVPDTFPKLIRQQIRWRKSFIRCCSSTTKAYWRRPVPAMIIYYSQLIMRLIRPFIIVKALILLPLSGDFISGSFYIIGVLLTGTIYAWDFRIHNPGNNIWIYRPLMALLSTFVYVWLLFYAMISIRKATWR